MLDNMCEYDIAYLYRTEKSIKDLTEILIAGDDDDQLERRIRDVFGPDDNRFDEIVFTGCELPGELDLQPVILTLRGLVPKEGNRTRNVRVIRYPCISQPISEEIDRPEVLQGTLKVDILSIQIKCVPDRLVKWDLTELWSLGDTVNDESRCGKFCAETLRVEILGWKKPFVENKLASHIIDPIARSYEGKEVQFIIDPNEGSDTIEIPPEELEHKLLELGSNFINVSVELTAHQPQMQQNITHQPHTLFASLGTKEIIYSCPVFMPTKIISRCPSVMPRLKGIPEPRGNGKGVALAILGPGYDSIHPMLSGCRLSRNFAQENACMFDSSQVGTALACLAAGKTVQNQDGIASNSSLIVCKTTLPNGSIKPGATAKAISWLREKWPDWQGDRRRMGQKLHTLIVLIPYGGQYMQDEMESIHRAIDEGIVVVCAAGKRGKGIAFPAALGNVICVSGNDEGPRGREVDVTENTSVTFPATKLESTRAGASSLLAFADAQRQDDTEGPTILQGTGVAATIISGLIALLASRIKLLRAEVAHKYDILKRKLKPGQLHNAVVRELLLMSSSEESSGTSRAVGELLQDGDKLHRYLLHILDRGKQEISGSKQSREDADDTRMSLAERERFFLGLTGSSITVAICDKDFPVDGRRSICQKIVSADSDSSDIDIGSGDGDSGSSDDESSHGLCCGLLNCRAPECSHGLNCAEVVKDTAPDTIRIGVNDRSHDMSASYGCLAKKNEVDIITSSIAVPFFLPDLSKAITDAVLKGKIVICPAGNEGRAGRSTICYPGRLGNVLVIGGRDRYLNPLPFSSIGRELDFLAPAVVSFGPSQEVEGGTSYAAPAVAGYVAMLLQFIKENMVGEFIEAWALKDGEWDWRPVPVLDAAHNVYAMRALLKSLASQPPPKDGGYRCFDLKILFQCANEESRAPVKQCAKKGIIKVLKDFYMKYE